MVFVRKKEPKRFCSTCDTKTNCKICPECGEHTSIRMMRACRNCGIETLENFCPECKGQTGDISGDDDTFWINDKHRKCRECKIETNNVSCPRCGEQTVGIFS